MLTPDSSRFWPADDYAPGRSQPSFDKQPLRDYLDARAAGGPLERRRAAARRCPARSSQATSVRYLDAFRRLTGATLDIAELT